jgi:hypothetical protein
VADHDEHEEGYTGPAVLTVDGRDLPVHAQLDSRHEPHDGRLHWFGRLRLDDGATVPEGASAVDLATPAGRAPARLGDLDLWGRYRVTGVGPPPYAVDEPDTAVD